MGWTGCSGPATQEGLVATYSIVAADVDGAELGVAVQSKFFSVGSVVPWAEADVGAVATQALANPRYGPGMLDGMSGGGVPERLLAGLVQADAGRERRQVGAVNAAGMTAVHTGAECFDHAGHRVGEGFVVLGNLLAGPQVLDAMAETFEARRAEGVDLAESLVEALQAGEEAGGDRRGRQSAALLVVREGSGYQGVDDRFIDLRVEDHENPTVELARLLEIHRAFFAERHLR